MRSFLVDDHVLNDYPTAVRGDVFEGCSINDLAAILDIADSVQEEGQTLCVKSILDESVVCLSFEALVTFQNSN